MVYYHIGKTLEPDPILLSQMNPVHALLSQFLQIHYNVFLPSTFRHFKWFFPSGFPAGKSLARQGRKQATATRLAIYSTHSPRSSINFLARCSIFCKPLKKKSEGCPSNQVSAAAMTSASDEKWRPELSILFSVQGTGGSLTGPDPENRVGDQHTGSPGRPVSSGLQVPGEPGHCRASTRPPW